MKTLQERALQSIDKRYNATIVDDQLIVNVPGEQTPQVFFKERNNEVKLTDNFIYLAPEDFNDYLKSCEDDRKYAALTLKLFKTIMGKKISYYYIDSDNGNISGEGVITGYSSVTDEFMRYNVQMEVTKGEALTHFYLYSKSGFLLAGDDADPIKFNILQ